MPVNMTTDLPKTLYYLLYAKYGNSSIADTDENQFKYKVWQTIFMYGPAWKMRLKIQEKLINLDPDGDDIAHGTIMFYNHAENPDTAPGTGTFQTLDGINSQSTSNVKRGKLEGYATLSALINTDVTEEFLEMFKKLFITVVSSQGARYYQEVGEDPPPEILEAMGYTSFGSYMTKTFQEIWPDVTSFVTDYQSNGIPKTI